MLQPATWRRPAPTRVTLPATAVAVSLLDILRVFVLTWIRARSPFPRRKPGSTSLQRIIRRELTN